MIYFIKEGFWKGAVIEGIRLGPYIWMKNKHIHFPAEYCVCLDPDYPDN